MTFDGYLKVYGKYEQVKDDVLAAIGGQSEELTKTCTLEGKQHFTEPPLRYSEARLIKELEEKGIGRPSTYAMIIDTLQARGYATLEKSSEGSRTKVFVPSEQGELTDQKLQEFFSAHHQCACIRPTWSPISMRSPAENATMSRSCRSSGMSFDPLVAECV